MSGMNDNSPPHGDENDQQLREVLRMSLLEYQESYLGSSTADGQSRASPERNLQNAAKSDAALSALHAEESGYSVAIEVSLSGASGINEITGGGCALTFDNVAEKLENDDLTELLQDMKSSKKSGDDRFILTLPDEIVPPSDTSNSDPTTPKVAIASSSSSVSDTKKQRVDAEAGDTANNALVFESDKGTDGMERMEQKKLLSILKLMFGGDEHHPISEDTIRWFNHTFSFSSSVNWGLLQNQGGPCGILASVQAWIIRGLFHTKKSAASTGSSENKEPTPSQPSISVTADGTPPETNEFTCESLEHQFTNTELWIALVKAVCAILYQCTSISHYVIVFIDSSKFDGNIATCTYDDLAEGWYAEFDKIQKLYSFLINHQHLLKARTSVISFVCSVIATRGVDRVIKDMDDSSQSMVRMYGHSSQELVNLLLSGKASSNVFDGDRVLGTDASVDPALRLGGITKRPAIGFLTELEGLRYMEVGQCFKHPYFPIWVVGGSNHYTTLFSPDIRVSRLSLGDVVDKEAAKAFDKFDLNGEKIVYAHLLEPLLKECGMDKFYYEARASLDIDCGVILYNDFLDWYTTMKTSLFGTTDSRPPNCMKMYYYDGQDPPGPSLRTYIVERTDLDKRLAQSDVSEIARVLWTRWPGCIVSEVSTR